MLTKTTKITEEIKDDLVHKFYHRWDKEKIVSYIHSKYGVPDDEEKFKELLFKIECAVLEFRIRLGTIN